MAHTDDIRADVLESVARQIGNYVERGLEEELLVKEPPDGVSDDVGDEEPLKLEDSLLVFRLSPEALDAIRNSRAAGDLHEWATPAQRTHHQIYLLGEPKAYARSRVLPAPPSDEHEDVAAEVALSQLNVSPLAARVEAALKVIKENREHDKVVAADPVVRMLDLPSYHILALWIYAEALNQSRLLVILAPKRFGAEWARRFLTTEEFFDRLRSAGPLAGTA